MNRTTCIILAEILVTLEGYSACKLRAFDAVVKKPGGAVLNVELAQHQIHTGVLRLFPVYCIRDLSDRLRPAKHKL